MKECCRNCKHMVKGKHNFQRGKGFESAYFCIVFKGETDGWIQEVTLDDRCEMFEGKDE